MRVLHSQLMSFLGFKKVTSGGEIESDLRKDENVYVGGNMGKRQMFLVLAFFSGIMFLSGTSSLIISRLGDELGRQFVILSSATGVILVIAGIILLRYLMKEIR